jgi:hypothetical protein
MSRTLVDPADVAAVMAACEKDDEVDPITCLDLIRSISLEHLRATCEAAIERGEALLPSDPFVLDAAGLTDILYQVE